MKILVFADSHGYTSKIIKALKNHRDIKYLLHAGDYASDIRDILEYDPSIVIEAVQGNNDKDKSYPLEKLIELAGKRVFLTHGHNYKVSNNNTDTLIKKSLDENAQIVIFGHSHVPLIKEEKGILFINPGSIYRQRISSGPTYAVLEIYDNIAEAKIYKADNL